MNLPKNIKDRVEEEVNKIYLSTELERSLFRNGSYALWSILTEVSEDEEWKIDREAMAEFNGCNSTNECRAAFRYGARFMRALCEVKK